MQNLCKKCLTFTWRCAIIFSADNAQYANVAQSVEQLIRNQQVRGPSPLIGSRRRGVAQLGSAFGSGPKGRGFESRHFDTCETLANAGVFLF